MKTPLLAPLAMLSAVLAAPGQAAGNTIFSTDLFADFVPEGGVEGATGDFNGEVDLAKGRICYYLDVADLSDANGVGIYEGEKSKTGRAVISLTLPKEGGKEVCATVEKELLQTMVQAPANYYVAISNPAHPNGAIRGQLGD